MGANRFVLAGVAGRRGTLKDLPNDLGPDIRGRIKITLVSRSGS